MLLSISLCLVLVMHNLVSCETTLKDEIMQEVRYMLEELETKLKISAVNDTEDLENRVVVLEFEMDIVQGDVVILYDDVEELRNQDSLTDIRLTEIEEFIATPWIACESSPCDNGATCVDVNIDTFICLCRDGFFGPTCSNGYADTLFLATIEAQEVTPVENPIIFNETRLDLGGNYDNATGIFTVPIDGIYEFNVNVFSYPDNDFGAFLVGDGIRMAHCRNADGSGTGHMSSGFIVPIHARAGQEFWVQPWSLDAIFGRYDSGGGLVSWFAAHLISAD